jgi:tripartite-type tricarboxylate transporter receptor subunit TctC
LNFLKILFSVFHGVNSIMKKLFTIFIFAFAAITISAAELDLRKDIVTIVVPQGPGPSTVLCLKLGQLLREKGITVLVVNKPGASKVIGTNFVASADPDGRTLLITSAADMALLPQVMPEVAKFNRNSFVPVFSLVAGVPALAVRNNFPANNLREFLDVIKRNPQQRQISMYSSNTKLMASAVYSLVETSPEIIAYNSEEKALSEVASGDLQAGIFTANDQLRAMAATGKIKVIAALSEKRSARFPAVESISESFPGTKFQYWWGLYAPAGTPETTIRELHRAFTDVWSDPKVMAELEQMNFQLAVMTLPTLNVYLDQTYKTLDLLSARYMK